MLNMTKTEVQELLGLPSGAALAKALGITRSAVAQWADDKPIPQRQMLRLKYEIRPDVDWPTEAKAA